MRINKQTVDKLIIPAPGDKGQTNQRRYYDDTLKGFGVRVTSGGTKAFFVEKAVHSKLRRITVGHYPALTVEIARKEAQKLLGKIATGIDPIAEREQAKMQRVTLGEAFESYKQSRKSLKESTLYDYERVMVVAFGEWQTKTLLEITREEVSVYHQKLAETRGKAYANLAMRLLRAIFNFASSKYRNVQNQALILENPVSLLSQTRAWYRLKRRQTYIKQHELAGWHHHIEQLENETIRDYLLLILFTGLRRNEAAKLTWDQVDLIAKTLTVPDPKNHQPHTLPLSDFLCNLLNKRKTAHTNDYVFSGTGKNGHLIEPRKQMQKIMEKTGLKFTIHDLRRTFITIAESLDIPAYALKRLLNHKMSNDITAGYIINDVERLRRPMQIITDYIKKIVEPAMKEEVVI